MSVFVTVLSEKWPVLDRHERAAEWLQIWSDLGRAPRTIDAYARGLGEFLLVCERDGIDPETANPHRRPAPHHGPGPTATTSPPPPCAAGETSCARKLAPAERDVYLITSLPPGAATGAQLAAWIRGHWTDRPRPRPTPRGPTRPGSR
ncbi:hypothetical protein [Streptomyces luteolifulvus]|uniref:hypothetical protein n=1 Tax=Streptomyces luteolifulvus TaxID=2615112 RepID=UPI001CD92996|nr:hypothetical protein [Streptomyces luteolifulvus]